jgi:hypothetical protein
VWDPDSFFTGIGDTDSFEMTAIDSCDGESEDITDDFGTFASGKTAIAA